MSEFENSKTESGRSQEQRPERTDDDVVDSHSYVEADGKLDGECKLDRNDVLPYEEIFSQVVEILEGIYPVLEQIRYVSDLEEYSFANAYFALLEDKITHMPVPVIATYKAIHDNELPHVIDKNFDLRMGRDLSSLPEVKQLEVYRTFVLLHEIGHAYNWLIDHNPKENFQESLRNLINKRIHEEKATAHLPISILPLPADRDIYDMSFTDLQKMFDDNRDVLINYGIYNAPLLQEAMIRVKKNSPEEKRADQFARDHIGLIYPYLNKVSG